MFFRRISGLHVHWYHVDSRWVYTTVDADHIYYYFWSSFVVIILFGREVPGKYDISKIVSDLCPAQDGPGTYNNILKSTLAIAAEATGRKLTTLTPRTHNQLLHNRFFHILYVYTCPSVFGTLFL